MFRNEKNGRNGPELAHASFRTMYSFQSNLSRSQELLSPKRILKLIGESLFQVLEMVSGAILKAIIVRNVWFCVRKNLSRSIKQLNALVKKLITV